MKLSKWMLVTIAISAPAFVMAQTTISPVMRAVVATPQETDRFSELAAEIASLKAENSKISSELAAFKEQYAHHVHHYDDLAAVWQTVSINGQPVSHVTKNEPITKESTPPVW